MVFPQDSRPFGMPRLGSGTNQDARGDHIHDGGSSKILPDYVRNDTFRTELAKVIQRGWVDLPLAAANNASSDIVFPVPFANLPSITVGSAHSFFYAAFDSVTVNGFKIWVRHHAGTSVTTTVRAHWIATDL